MKKKRFTETQIFSILKEFDAGKNSQEISREHGVSKATIYNLKAKYGGMGMNELKKTTNSLMTRVLLTFITTLLILTSYAQDDVTARSKTNAPKPFISSLEFLVGPSMVFLRGDDYWKEVSVFKAGYFAGILAVHEFNGRMKISMGFSYERKGSKTINYSLNPDYAPPAVRKHITNLDLNYVGVTLMQRYGITKNEKFLLGFGPYFSHLLGVRVSSELYENGTIINKSSGRLNVGFNHKILDLGLGMMLGYNFHRNEKRAGSVQLQYRYGIVVVNQEMLPQMRNHSVSLVLGIAVNKNIYVKP
jgi:hypothetical protein